MSNIKLFESKQIRSEWSESEQKWYFAIIDIVEILTESNNPRRYWSDLKRKLNSEGFSQLYEIIVQLKMVSSDGKKYVTDCADAKSQKGFYIRGCINMIFIPTLLPKLSPTRR